MTGPRGESDRGAVPLGATVGAGPRSAGASGPLGEPGILLRMVLPSPDVQLPAADAAAGATAPVTWLRLALLSAALGFGLVDAAAVGFDTLVARSAFPDQAAVLAAVAVLLGLVLAFAPRRASGRAALDVATVTLLGVTVLAGAGQRDGVRLGAGAAAVLLVLVGDFAAAGPTTRWRALQHTLLGAGAAFAAAGAWPLLRSALGAPAAGACATALVLLVVGLPRPVGATAPPRPRELAAALACLPLWWWIVAAWPPADLGLAAAGTAGGGGAIAAALVTRAVGAAVGLGAVAALLGALPAAAPTDPAAAVLAAHGRDVVTYDRAAQTMTLSVDGAVVARAGPDHAGAELAAATAYVFAAPGDRALVLGAGSGRLPDALLACGYHEVEVVDARGAALAIWPVLRRDGPVPTPATAAADPRVRVVARSWRQHLAGLPAGGRQVVLVAESPHARAPLQATVEQQRELRRVAGDGLVVQVIALDVVDAGALRALLGAAAVAHGYNAVLAAGGDAGLLSAVAAPAWPARDVFETACDDVRWLAYRAHLGGLADLRRALLGTVHRGAAVSARSEVDAPPHDGVTGRRTALAVLHELLEPDPHTIVADPTSVLLRWIGQRADLRLAATELAGLGDDAESRPRANAIAARFLPIGAPCACLQAALALPAADGLPLVDPALAARRAHAIDPTFWTVRPPVLTSIRRVSAVRGELEDLATLPPRARLAELCAGDEPFAVALRARFPSACARALVAALAERPLAPAATEALRQLADPFVLGEAARVLRRPDALVELLALWRRDLPLPTALADLSQCGDVGQRVRFADALAGRADAGALAALAACLVAPAREVRQAAARALRSTVGDRIAYDPDGPASVWNEAADRVRSLHNRTP